LLRPWKRWALAASLIVALVFFAPATAALALCPNCLGQARSLAPTLRLLGAFLLVPFVAFYVALRLIRRACRADPGGP
jgi:membrane protease YdiL (CAAX protease family)